MAITVRISQPNVYNQYGILLVNGQSYSLDDAFAQSLVQQGRAVDTSGALVAPYSQPYLFGGYFDANGNIIGVQSDTGVAALAASQLPWASRPTLGSTIKGAFFATDVGGGNFFYWNGVRWKVVNGSCILDSIDTANVGTATASEQQLNASHALIPAGVIGGNDRLRITGGFSKSGATDTVILRVRIGSAGTTADPIVATINLAAATLSAGFYLQLKRASATSIRLQGSANTLLSYGSESTSAYAAAVTIPNMDTTGLYISVTAQMSGTTDIPTLQDYTAEIYSTDSV